MNKFWYYLGYIWIPFLFLIHFTQNMYRALKHCWNNTIIQTHSDIESARRYYKIK